MTIGDAVRPLPIQIRPAQGETADSYLRRLARANHLRPSYLRAYLNRGQRTPYAPVQPEDLAGITGRTAAALHHALAKPTHRPRSAQPRPTPAEQAEKHAERTELFAAIRYAVRKEGISIRAAERRFHVHRRTINQALTNPEPPPRKKITREPYALNGLHDRINAILQAEPDIAAGHVWERLIDEHDTTVSYASVRGYINHHRPVQSQNKASSDKIG